LLRTNERQVTQNDSRCIAFNNMVPVMASVLCMYFNEHVHFLVLRASLIRS